MGLFSFLGSFAAMQFERDGDHWIYRANAKGTPIRVSDADRNRFVRKAGVSFILHTAVFMLSVIAAAMVTALWFPEGGEMGGFFLMGGLLILICYLIYRSIHWSLREPERMFWDQSSAPSAPAPRSRPLSHPRTTSPADPAKRGGCLMLLAFAFAELVGGIGAAIAAYGVIHAVTEPVVPTHAHAIGLAGGFIAALVSVYLIDRWCERKTGSSIIGSIPTVS